MINNVTLHRLPDGLPVPVFAFHWRSMPPPGQWGFDALLPPPQKRLSPGKQRRPGRTGSQRQRHAVSRAG